MSDRCEIPDCNKKSSWVIVERIPIPILREPIVISYHTCYECKEKLCGKNKKGVKK